jgi:hypothetical protein
VPPARGSDSTGDQIERNRAAGARVGDRLVRNLLPQSEDVARRISERRDTKVALGVRSPDDLAPVGADSRDDIVADVPAAVVEGWPVAVVVADRPTEDRFVEPRSLVHIDGGNVQVRDRAGALEQLFDAGIRRFGRLCSVYFGCGVIRR